MLPYLESTYFVGRNIIYKGIIKMMNKINENSWLIGIDLDGTLVRGEKFNESHKVTDLTKRVIEEMYDKGHIVCIDTGRGHYGSRYVYESIGTPVPSINHAGAHIHNPSDESFKQIVTPINKTILKEILTNDKYSSKIIIKSFDAPHESYFDGDGYNDLKVGLENIGARTYSNGTFPNINDVEFTAINIVYDSSEKEIYEIISHLENKYGNEINVVPWITDVAKTFVAYGIEINVAKMGKGLALNVLANELGISVNRTMGIGDSPNDKDLMLSTNVGVAMKNAEQEIIDLSDEITEFTNEEEGVAKYLIRKFNLNIEY